MARTKTYMSWRDVTVTPAGGSAIPITEVTDIDLVDKDGLEPWQADGHKFATQIVAATGVRGMTIHGGDVSKLLLGVPSGTPCVIVAKLYDSKNGVGEGCLTVTLSNAVRDDSSATGKTNKFATSSVSFMAFSSDGATDPLAVVEAPAP